MHGGGLTFISTGLNQTCRTFSMICSMMMTGIGCLPGRTTEGTVGLICHISMSTTMIAYLLYYTIL